MGSCDAGQATTSEDTVTFNVGGEKFEILEQSIRAKPETLLCTLLDDPGRKDPTKPIFVNGDAKRFRYVLDWYRYGSIKLPSCVSQEEMHRDLAFYQLPADTKIARERPLDFIQGACKELRRCHETAAARRKQVASTMGAASTYCFLLEQLGKIMMESVTSNVPQVMVQAAVDEKVWNPSRLADRTEVIRQVIQLAAADGLTCSGSAHPLDYNKLQMKCEPGGSKTPSA